MPTGPPTNLLAWAWKLRRRRKEFRASIADRRQIETNIFDVSEALERTKIESPMTDSRLKDRVLGCLLGGALGDAWGGPWEGKPGPVQFVVPTRPMLSDDTELTLATCESIIDECLVEPESLARHFVRWFNARRIHGVGSSTLKALRDLSAGTHWALAGARGEYAAGNGAAMRIAPLAFLLDPNDPRQRTIIRDACRITHHSDEAYVGALAVIFAIRAVFTQEWTPQRSFLSCVVRCLPDSAVRDRMLQLMPLELPIEEVGHRFGTTGYVVDTVPFALYCAQRIVEHPLDVTLARTISAGGDTDTTASITGQLAGTVVGLAGVPQEMFAQVERGGQVLSIAHTFANFVEQTDPKTNG